MKKSLLKTIYHLGAFAPFQWAHRDKVLILTYHRFSREPSADKISAAEFAAHLEYLNKHNRVLALSEVIENLQDEKSLPPNTVVITIDDGYQDAFEIAFPILKRFNFPATVYAVTDFLDKKCWLWTDLMRYVLLETETGAAEIEFEGEDKIEANLSDERQRLETASRINSRLKKLPNDAKERKIKEIAQILAVEIPVLPTEEFAPITWEQAREMDADGVQIESHTVTHPILTNIPEPDLDYELTGSKRRLEEVLDRKVENFCYPNGSLDETVWKAVENSGYRCAVTTNYGFNRKDTNQFLLNRIDAQSAIENFAQSASGFEILRQKIKI